MSSTITSNGSTNGVKGLVTYTVTKTEEIQADTYAELDGVANDVAYAASSSMDNVELISIEVLK